ncbi:MarR family winged helix-turn-helix transcriptional regulator [Streptomyces sp. NPDC058470]|uniref:MarR family winged helix-turn-helix transcriptional regulator n=1 Tax=Streptomyces sp. NPDC058470 TaxID=3346515 RepID=UPI00365B77B0
MPPEDRLGLDIKRAEQELIAAKSAAVKTVGLTVPQYAALLGLNGSPGISAAALARACLVTPQAMNVVLKNLHERGLVARTPHPWHGNVLHTQLTREGIEAFEAADVRAVEIERRISGAFSPEERELLRSLLTRAVSAIRDDAV